MCRVKCKIYLKLWVMVRKDTKPQCRIHLYNCLLDISMWMAFRTLNPTKESTDIILPIKVHLVKLWFSQ